MSKPIIITFSGKANHGKNTAVDFLKDLLTQQGNKVLAINYADHLKHLATQYMGWDGNKDEKGRTLLQLLGTEKVRSRFPNYWIDHVIQLAKIFEGDFDYILIGDCRFPNEIKRWEDEKYKVITVFVERKGFESMLNEEQKNHPSEIALNDYTFNFKIKASSLEELSEAIEMLFKTKIEQLYIGD